MLDGGFTADVVTLVLAIGPPLLLVLFFGEGLIVGKLVQPPLVLVGYVVVASPPTVVLAGLAVGCVLATTAGQWVLYREFDDDIEDSFGGVIPYLDRLPSIIQRRIGPRRMRLVDRWFERFGAIGIATSNAVPGIRCLMTIPAALSSYSPRRFLIASTVGSALYIVILIAIATELRHLIGG